MRNLRLIFALTSGVLFAGCGGGSDPVRGDGGAVDGAVSADSGELDAAADTQTTSDAGALDATSPDLLSSDGPAADARIGDAAVLPDGGSSAAIWPADATRLIAENRGGGFIAPPPAGSQCSYGESRFTMTVADRLLIWHVCRQTAAQTPLVWVDGQRVLTAEELDSVVKPLQKLTPPKSSGCGADKSVLAMKIATPAGETEYLDSFYQCQKKGIYVDGMDAVFAALGKLAPSS